MIEPMSGLMCGKTCLITGGNSGIGKETAIALAGMGATVVIVSRDPARGEAALEDIKAQSGNKSVDMLQADLSDLSMVRQLAEDFCSRYRALHVLINNAGGVFMPRQETADGLEMTFAVNHLAHFLLTYLLLDHLEGSAPSRIINVSSIVHRKGRIDFDDLMAEKRYFSFEAYAQSKLANVLFTYALAQRLEGTGVTVNALHPGVVATGFGQKTNWFFSRLVKIGRFVMIDAKEGARTSIHLASSPTLQRISGKYFERCREIRSSRLSYDPALARRLWEVSEVLTGLRS